MTPERILIKQGTTNDGSGGTVLPINMLAEPGYSTDQNFLLIGTGTATPSLVQTTHTSVVIDYTDTPGIAQSHYFTGDGSGPSDPAYRINKDRVTPSGFCEPAPGQVGVVIDGVVIGTFSAAGLELNGGLTYTGSGGVILSSGTSAERPSAPVVAFIWYNTTINNIEYWNGTAWTTITGGGGGGLSPWVKINSNYTASAGDRIEANSDAGGFTITFPPTPADKAEIEVMGDFATHNVMIDPGAKLIARVAGLFPLNKDNISPRFVYDSTITSWRIRQ